MGRQKQIVTKFRLDRDLSLPTDKHLLLENEELRAKLAEAEETLRAIRSGEVDAIVVSGPGGEQLFTLKGAEYAYRALVEAMNEGSATISGDGTVLYCNQRLSDLLVIPPERIIGAPVARLLAPGSAEEFTALFASALAGEGGRFELTLRRADHEHVSAYVSLGRIEGCEPAAVCMVVTDLTEHKQRDELIASGELARSILASAAEAIAVCNNDGVIITANHALSSLCGFNPLFQPFDDVLPLQIVDGEAGLRPFSVLAALSGEDFRTREATFNRADGKLLTLLLSAAQVSASAGPAGCVLTLTDITERKRMEQGLRERNVEARARANELATLMDAMPAAIFLSHDPECRKMTGNRAAHELLRLSYNAEISRSAPEGNRPTFRTTRNGRELSPEELPMQMATASGRAVRDAEFTVVFDDGSSRDFLGNAVPLFDDSGRVRGAVGAFIDVSDRKKAEEALIRSEKLAALGRLAATIAHEVNNPLAAAMNAIFIASGDAGLAPQTRSALELADQELRRAAHITSRTLGFYRDKNSAGPIELPKLIDEVVGVYARKLQEQGIKVLRRYRCYCRPQSCFIADAGELRQVISNLLMNGMDAIRENGTVHIRLARLSDLRGNGAVIRLTIADTGSGIRSEHLSRIFEPFFTTKERTGTGLGMWVSQEIIRKHGGSIRVRSKEGKGTVCCVTVPALAEDATASGNASEGHCTAFDGDKSTKPEL